MGPIETIAIVSAVYAVVFLAHRATRPEPEDEREEVLRPNSERAGESAL